MESFSLKTKTGNPVSRAARRPGIPSPFVTFHKAADLLRRFSRPKPRLVQSRLAVSSIINMTPKRFDVNRKGRLGQLARLLLLLHPTVMTVVSVQYYYRLSLVKPKQ